MKIENIDVLVDVIASDLEQGIPKQTIIDYWSRKLGQQQSNQPHPKLENSVQRILKADADKIIDLLSKATKEYSYASIARAIYGEDADAGKSFKLRNWINGINTPTKKSIEEIRKFLVELVQGKHDDILKAPGGNRRS